MLTALYYHARNNYPAVYFAVLILAITIIATQIISFTANNTAFFDMLGMSTAKTKIIAAKETAYWHYRAWLNNDKATDLKPEKAYGFMQSVNRDGTINITIIKNNKYQTQRITLADSIVTDSNTLAVAVELHKHEDADFDLYNTGNTHPYTVIWLNGKPFNLQLITTGIVNPDTTPPTNIVDRLFAEYYWKQLTDS